MLVTDITQHFQVQIESASPTTKENIDAMVEVRKQSDQPKSEILHIASKVGVKQLFYIIRNSDTVEIRRVWEDELSELAADLSSYLYHRENPVSQMPEFVHKDIAHLYGET